MKERKLFLVVFVLCLSVLFLSACSLLDSINGKLGNDSGVKVEKIEIAESQIILAPSGTYGEKQLKPVVLPQNASNKKVTYRILENEAASYFMVTADGLVRALGSEIPNEVYYTIRITSSQDSKVYLDVKVTVMTAEVKRISFGNLTEVIIEIGDTEGVQINPIIIPVFAVINGQIRYEIIKEQVKPEDLEEGENPPPDIASVTEFGGLITPLNPGHTSLRVEYKSNEGKIIEAFLPVKVVYPPLNYRMKARVTSESIYKQMEGATESFYIDVSKNADDPCDPNPQITWYLNDSEIPNSSDFRGKLSVLIEPSKLGMNRGIHKIAVKLESLGQEPQILELDPITVYAPLSIFQLTKLSDKTSFSVGDVVSFRATHANGEYPPDKYSWYYVDVKSGDQEIYIGESLPVDGMGILNFAITKSGDYHIVCYPVIKSTEATTLRRSTYLGNVGVVAVVPGENITGVFVDGAIVEGETVAYIKWDSLAYSTNYSVSIRSTKDNIQLDSTNQQHKKYFTDYGVYVPTEVATLEDSFTFRIKSTKYEYTRDFSYTGGTIKPEAYPYLDTVHLDYNRYIANIEELGELINYISLFRPNDYAIGQSSNSFELSLYLPIEYENIKNEYKSNLNYDKGLTGDAAKRQNVINLFKVATTSYCDTVPFDIDVSLDSTGGALIKLNFPDLITTYLDTNPANDVTNYTFLPHYAKNLYGFSSTDRTELLPIDGISKTISVTTSNQLYYAVSLGYKPVPVKGSAAEDIYNQARAILKDIIRDNMTDAQKVHAIYDFLSVDLVYDYELASIDASTLSDPTDIYRYKGFFLEGVFRNGAVGKAVCDGIAKAFNLLCRMEGIAAKKIIGEAGSGVDMSGHAWNIVLVDNVWYLCDATWGNQRKDLIYEFQTHVYLLAPASEFTDHYASGKYPVASNSRYNVLKNTYIAASTRPYLETNDDVKNLATYIENVMSSSNVIWIELYIEPSVGGSKPSSYHNTITELLRQYAPALTAYNFEWFDVGGSYRLLHIYK